LPATSTALRSRQEVSTNQETAAGSRQQELAVYFNIVGDTYIIRDIIPHPKK